MVQAISGLFLLVVFVLVQTAKCAAINKAYKQWIYAHGTFYGDWDGRGTVGGACGYGDIWKAGYGKDNTAVSSVIWQRGVACGSCLQVVCINTKRWKFCLKGRRSVVVTVTNMCPPNWKKPSHKGGWCNNPRRHLDMSMHSFLKLAQYRAGIVPIAYRRVPCQRRGGIVFRMQGNPWWLEVSIQNLAGSGDLREVYFKSPTSPWIKMHRNWGVVYSKACKVLGKTLHFVLRSYLTNEVIYVPNGVPRFWRNGKSYKTNKQFAMPLIGRGLSLEDVPESFKKDIKEFYDLFGNEKLTDEETSGGPTGSLDEESVDDKLPPDFSRENYQSKHVNGSLQIDDSSDGYEFEKRVYPSLEEIESWEKEQESLLKSIGNRV